MNRKSIIRMGWWLASAAMVMLVTAARADTPAVVWGGNWGFQSLRSAGSFGWQFSRAGTGLQTNILVTQLGVFDIAGDGLANPHEVGLWSNSGVSGTLLASAVVPAGTDAPLIGGYRWVEIAPVLIPFALGSYAVAAHYTDDDPDHLFTPTPALPGGVAPEIGFVYGRLAPGLELAFPSGISTGSNPELPGPVFWEANFQYVVIPEPAAWMLISSAALFFLVRRRIQHQ